MVEEVFLRIGDLVAFSVPAINGFLEFAPSDNPREDPSMRVVEREHGDVPDEFKNTCVFQIYSPSRYEDGKEVNFGGVFHLRHVATRRFVTAKQYAVSELESDFQKVQVTLTESEEDQGTIFKILPRFKVRAEGERVRVGDYVVFQCREQTVNLHMSQATLDGTRCHELNAGNVKENTGFRIQLYAPFMPNADRVLKAGDVIRLFFKEREGHLCVEYGKRGLQEVYGHGVSVPDENTLVFLRTVYGPYGRVPTQVRNSNTLFMVEQAAPEEGGPLQWDGLCRIRHLGTGEYLAVRTIHEREKSGPKTRVVKLVQGETASTSSSPAPPLRAQLVMVPKALDPETLFIMKAVVATQGNISSSSYARIMNSGSNCWIHAKNAHFGGGTDMWSAEELEGTTESFEEDVFAIQQVSEEELVAFYTVTSTKPIIKNFMEKVCDCIKKGTFIQFGDTGPIKGVLSDLCMLCTQSTDTNPFTREGAPIKSNQKLIRDQKVMDLVLELTGLPFSGGPLKKNPASIKDPEYKPLFPVLQLCYRLLKQLCKENYKTGVVIHEYMPQFQQQLGFGLKIADTVMEIYRNNKSLLQDLDLKHIEFFVWMIRQYGKRARYLNFLQVLCSCSNEGIYKNQEAIRKRLLVDNKDLVLVTKPEKDDVYVEVDGKWKLLHDFVDQNRWTAAEPSYNARVELIEYYRMLLVLFSKMCLDRNKDTIQSVRGFIDVRCLFYMMRDNLLRPNLRKTACTLFMTCFLDCDPQEAQSTIEYTRVYNEIRQERIPREDPSTVEVLHGVGTWLTSYLKSINLLTVEDTDQTELNMFTDAVVLKLLVGYIRYGLLHTEQDLADIEHGVTGVLATSKEAVEAIDATPLEQRQSVIVCKMQLCHILKLIWDKRTNGRLSTALEFFKREQQNFSMYSLGKSGVLERDVPKDEQKIYEKVKNTLKHEWRDFNTSTPEEFGQIRDILLGLTLYESDTLAQLALELIVKLFSQSMEVHDALAQVQLLVTQENVRTFSLVKERQAKLRLILQDGLDKKDEPIIIDTLTQFCAMCSKDAQGNVPHNENQRIFRNFGVHEDIMRILHTPFSNKLPEEQGLREIFLLSYRFLKLFVADNAENQELMVRHQKFMLQHMGVKLKVADTMAEIFQGNKVACIQASNNLLTFYVNLCINAGKFPRYLRFLKTVVAGEGEPIKDNQVRVQKVLMEKATTILHLFKDEGGFHPNEIKALVTQLDHVKEKEGILNYHLQLVDVLALCADGENEHGRAQLQTLLTHKDIFGILNDPEMAHIVKIPYLRFLLNVFLKKRTGYRKQPFLPFPVPDTLEDFKVLLDSFLHDILEVAESQSKILAEDTTGESVKLTRRMSLSYIAEQANDADRRALEVQGYVFGAILPFLTFYYENAFFPREDDAHRHVLHEALIEYHRKLVDALGRLMEATKEHKLAESIALCLNFMRRLQLEGNVLKGRKLDDIAGSSKVDSQISFRRIYSTKPRARALSSEELEMMEMSGSIEISSPGSVISGLQAFTRVFGEKAKEIGELAKMAEFFQDHLQNIIEDCLRKEILAAAEAEEDEEEEEGGGGGTFDPFSTLISGTALLTKTLERGVNLVTDITSSLGAGIFGGDTERMQFNTPDLSRLYFRKIISHVCEAAVSASQGALKEGAQNIMSTYLRVLKRACQNAEDMDAKHDYGKISLEQDVEKIDWPERSQNQLNELGVVRMVLQLMVSRNPRLLYEAMKLGNEVLCGGNVKIQNSIKSILMEKEEKTVFTELRQCIRQYSIEIKESSDDDVAIKEGRKSPMEYMTVILRFLQLLCEGHNTFMQNYIRSQSDTKEPVDLIGEVIAFYVVFQGDIRANLSGVPTKSTVEKQKQMIDLATQLFEFFTEICQGPCPENQDHLIRGNVCGPVIELLRKIRTEQDSNIEALRECFRTNDMEQRTFLLEVQGDLYALELAIVKMLLSLIEGNNDDSIFNRMITTLQAPSDVPKEYDVLFSNMENNVSISKVMERVAKLGRRRFRGKTKVAREECPFLCFNKDEEMAMRERSGQVLEVAFLYYTLIISLSEHDDTGRLRDALTRWEAVSKADDYLRAHMGRIEILREKKLEKVYFRVPEICLKQYKNKLVDSAKDKLLYSVRRDNPSDKIVDFFYRQEYIMDVIEWQNELRLLATKSPIFRFLKWLAKLDPYVKWCALLIAFAINILLLAFFDTNNEISSDGGEVAITVLGSVHIAFSCIMLLSHVVSWGPVIVRQHRKEAPSKGAESEDLDVMGRVQQILQSVVNIVKIFLISERVKHIVQSAFYVMVEPRTVYLIVYLVMSILGVAISPFFFCFHLFDITGRFRLLGYTLQSVTKNAGSLILTLSLGLVTIYFYAVIGFNAYTKGDDNEVRYMFADHSLFNKDFYYFSLSHWDYGFRSAPIKLPPDAAEDVKAFEGESFGVFLFNISYFLLINLILVAIISGIIIDTFGALRDEKNFIEEDMKGQCFICSIDRDVFEHKGSGFTAHIKRQHNMWRYMFFRMHLALKDHTEFTGQESYVADMIANGDIGWYPINRAMALESHSQEEVDLGEVAERMVNIEQTIGDVSERVDELIRTLRLRGQGESTPNVLLGRSLSGRFTPV